MKIILLSILLVFSTFIDAQYIKLFDFSGIASGKNPKGDLVSVGSYLYGMTSKGGTNNLGTVFKIKPDGTAYSKLLDFSGTSNGSIPYGSLVYDGTFLYGLTDSGGVNNLGTLFKIKTDGTGFSKLFDFSGTTTGANPLGSLFLNGNFLYGMTQFGGSANRGVVFKIATNGTSFVKLHDFGNTSDGLYPWGALISDGTFLYGVTIANIFKIKPDGTAYTVLYNFGALPDAEYGTGTLYYDGTFLYGMTESGGTENIGAIFKLKPDGTGYVKLLDFSSTGNTPIGSLVSDGTFLYGMTESGGGGNGCGGGCGAVFKIKPDGTSYTILFDFDGASTGKQPYGSLISSGAFLYGMAPGGGANGDGVLFELSPAAMGLSENIKSHVLTISPNPFCTETIIASDEYLEKAALTVCNLKGEVVRQLKNISGKIITFSRDDLPAGLYFVHLTQDDKSFLISKLILTDN